ncbi:MAG: alkaline phosphatase D family protein [Actinomycetota bacterium]
MVTATTAAALLLPASALAQEFTSGVTAGEITDDAAIVWGRAADPGYVKAQVALDSSFTNVVKQRILRAVVGNNNTVQTRFTGLQPNRTYRYRFCIQGGSGCSSVGKFLTAPPPYLRTPIRFAYSGDETGVKLPGDPDPAFGNFKVFGSMVAENNHFNIDFGDTIYSDPEVPNFTPALGVGQKWAMYRKKLAILNMQRVRSATGLYNHWDDHEFINDFSIPENGRPLYNRGVRAFRNYMPVTFSDERGIYRSVRWGKNLELFFLDQRSFRSAKASANGTCDNPETAGEPDLAPTAPQSTRNFFSALVPSLDQPVSQACKNRINSPNRTFLGKPQLSRFLNDVKTSTAIWKVVMNETPMQQFYALPYDRWEGYAYERLQLLNALQSANIDHLAFLTTDTHAGLANVVRERTLSGDVAPSNAPATAPVDTPYQDFVIGPVGTKTLWQEIDDVTGVAGSGQTISNAFFKPAATGNSPGGGMGMACAQGGENSYGEVTVTRDKLQVEYKDEDGNTLLDSNGSTPCGPYVLTD